MNNLFLDVYFGSKLAETITSNSTIADIFTYNNIIYFVVFLIVILAISIFAFLLPKALRTPEKSFKRYEAIRTEMENIDLLYSKKKISFEDYSFAQFHYAKEYEQLIIYLSKFEDYKPKLQSYKLTAVKIRENEYQKADQVEKQNIDTINYLCDILKPQTIYYKKEEIYQALLDEGFSQKIADGVIRKLDNTKTDYAVSEKEETHKIQDLVNSLVSVKPKTEKEEATSISLNLEELPKTKKQTIDDSKVKYLNYDTENKKSFFESLKDLFKPKEKTHTISEINDIFKDIERNLKK